MPPLPLGTAEGIIFYVICTHTSVIFPDDCDIRWWVFTRLFVSGARWYEDDL